VSLLLRYEPSKDVSDLRSARAASETSKAILFVEFLVELEHVLICAFHIIVTCSRSQSQRLMF